MKTPSTPQVRYVRYGEASIDAAETCSVMGQDSMGPREAAQINPTARQLAANAYPPATREIGRAHV